MIQFHLRWLYMGNVLFKKLYKSNSFMKLYWDERIIQYFTIKETVQENGGNRAHKSYIGSKSISILSNTELDKEFQAEALSYASHLINRMSIAKNKAKTPLELRSSHFATDYDHLHVFAYPAYCYIKESKLNSRVKKAIFLTQM